MFTLLFRIFKMLVGLSLIMVGLYKFVPVPYTPLMLERKIESIFTGKNRGSIQHDWVPLAQIPLSMRRAVVAAEDAKFYSHNGFDMEAIEKAMAYNKTHAKKKGASTISQQTAKNVFLWPSRSWIRKGFEAYFTFLIELAWSKDRILEVYLNVIEIGPNVYGVNAAAKKYFKKSSRELSPSEAALIAAVLPNPLKWHVESPSAFVLGRRGKILARMSPSYYAPHGGRSSMDLGPKNNEASKQTQGNAKSNSSGAGGEPRVGAGGGSLIGSGAAATGADDAEDDLKIDGADEADPEDND